eukprot:CAMPEP_0114228676 /NCGR_PEP_ID=MMETSP0058-20121206/2478_1 /TAXON_ID=36894 /ORGANISM="Pyramimonas parkeae, CCMP726" /LENGTH=140 /DNA_ID=CAMNT_0001339655 /DNA_START=521 /DNA_END=944 /DNA_ORIENTATION=-
MQFCSTNACSSGAAVKPFELFTYRKVRGKERDDLVKSLWQPSVTKAAYSSVSALDGPLTPVVGSLDGSPVEACLLRYAELMRAEDQFGDVEMVSVGSDELFALTEGAQALVVLFKQDSMPPMPDVLSQCLSGTDDLPFEF